MRISEWSSDVCSSDLLLPGIEAVALREWILHVERGSLHARGDTRLGVRERPAAMQRGVQVCFESRVWRRLPGAQLGTDVERCRHEVRDQHAYGLQRHVLGIRRDRKSTRLNSSP